MPDTIPNQPYPQAVYNGEVTPLTSVHISPLDRSYLFGESVYEVMSVLGGRVFHLTWHWERLQASARAMGLSLRYDSEQQLEQDLQLLMRGNDCTGDASVYLQCTDGELKARDVAARGDAPHSFLMLQQSVSGIDVNSEVTRSLTSMEDFRWTRSDVKATTLVAAAMMRRAAIAKGFDDALLVRDGFLTESTASNIFLAKDGVVTTPVLNGHLLPGTTRRWVLLLLKSLNIPVSEDRVSVEQVFSADEVWMTSALMGIAPVSRVDEQEFSVGPLAKQLIHAAAAEIAEFRSEADQKT